MWSVFPVPWNLSWLWLAWPIEFRGSDILEFPRLGPSSLAASTMTLTTLDLREVSHCDSLPPLGLPACQVAQLDEQRWHHDWPAQQVLVIPAQGPDRRGSEEAISDISSPADVTWRKTEKPADSWNHSLRYMNPVELVKQPPAMWAIPVITEQRWAVLTEPYPNPWPPQNPKHYNVVYCHFVPGLFVPQKLITRTRPLAEEYLKVPDGQEIIETLNTQPKSNVKIDVLICRWLQTFAIYLYLVLLFLFYLCSWGQWPKFIPRTGVP